MTCKNKTKSITWVIKLTPGVIRIHLGYSLCLNWNKTPFCHEIFTWLRLCYEKLVSLFTITLYRGRKNRLLFPWKAITLLSTTQRRKQESRNQQSHCLNIVPSVLFYSLWSDTTSSHRNYSVSLKCTVRLCVCMCSCAGLAHLMLCWSSQDALSWCIDRGISSILANQMKTWSQPVADEVAENHTLVKVQISYQKRTLVKGKSPSVYCT